MAKRHKGEDAEAEEEYDFIPPEFDEDHFIHKEMVSFHTTVTLFLAGIVAAIASWGAFAALDGARTGWLAGLFIVAIGFAFLKPLFRILNIDISHWARREWMGTGFLMFFAWLAFFIMFINPPISDFADPEVIVYAPGAANMGDDITLDVFYTDNGKIAERTFQLTGPVSLSLSDLTRLNDVHFQYELENAPAGVYTWTATGTDKKGGQGSSNGTFEVGDVLEVFEADLSVPTNQFLVKVPDNVNVWAVYADVTNGGRVFFEEDDKVGGWVATSNFDGWIDGQNNFTITVEERNQFQGQILVEGARITAGPFTTDVSDPGDYDKGTPKKANPTKAPTRNVPGIELPILVVGIVGLAVVARKRA